MKKTDKQMQLNKEFHLIIQDLLENPDVKKMNNFIQHSDVSCLMHCIHVSFISYIICKKLRFHFTKAARGGLLHDMFLYDWHTKHPFKLHGFTHPTTALINAQNSLSLDCCEEDIILNHMWPLTIYRIPKYKETYVVTFADKLCTVFEVFRLNKLSIFKYADNLVEQIAD